MGRRMLVLEDDRAIGESMIEVLSHDGHVAELVDSVSTATTALAAREYDAVILDLALHDESGMAVLDNIAQESPHTVIVVVSATLSVSVRQKCYANGAHDFISKPFDPVELVLRINRLLDQHSSL